MTKRPLSPEERLIASYLAGSGFHSALALKQLTFDQGGGEPEEDVLHLKLPREKLMQISKQSDDKQPAPDHTKLLGFLPKMLGKPATIGLGGYAGFQNSSKLYENMEREHLNKQLSQAEKEYLDMLGKVKHASETSDTPCVDAFVRGLVATASSSPEEIDKIAAQDDMADGSMQRFMGDMASPVTNMLHPIKEKAYAAAAIPTISSALAVYMLKQKMEGNRGQNNPSRIEIDPI